MKKGGWTIDEVNENEEFVVINVSHMGEPQWHEIVMSSRCSSIAIEAYLKDPPNSNGRYSFVLPKEWYNDEAQVNEYTAKMLNALPKEAFKSAIPYETWLYDELGDPTIVPRTGTPSY